MTWQKRYYMKDEENVFAVDESTSRKPRIIAFVVVFLLLLVALGFAANYYLNGRSQKHIAAAPTQMPSPTLIPSDTPTATPSGTVSKSSRISPAPAKATPTPASTNKGTAVSVEVLNGSGTEGAAGKMASSLQKLGYTVSSTGNADSYDYTNIVIQVKSSEPTLLNKLKNDLSSDYTIGSTSATLSDTSSTDAIVIVGK